MKDVKAMIPIITLVLLICVLAGTFAWFSSFQQVDMMGLLSVENPQEVVLLSSTLGALVEYNGQKGYDSSGNKKNPPDAPYIFDFDVAYKVVGDSDIDVAFGFEYIAIRLDAQKALPFSDVVRIVFGDTSFVDNADNRKAYLGLKGSYEYDPNEAGGADYFDNKGNHLTAKTIIYTYGPMYEADNEGKKGMLITKEADGTGDVTEIIIKNEYVAEYFHLQYAMYSAYTDADLPQDVVWQRFATLKRFEYSDIDKDVYENVLQCKPHKTKIQIGLYHDFGTTDAGKASQFGEFVFSNDVFRGCTFVFSFRISSEKVSV